MLTTDYTGFYIETPVGNNAFSFAQRQHQKIFVAPLIQGDLLDLALGEKIVFSEIEDGVERPCRGLKNFVYWPRNGQHIFVFDNHNHAFFFWMYALRQGWMDLGSALVHVDQHKDTRLPLENFAVNSFSDVSLRAVFEYTNFVLNVGNFIAPALACGMFERLDIIDSAAAFARPVPPEFVLDIDLDVFAPVMDYIPQDLKLRAIRECAQRAKVITVATSPYFMEQAAALDWVKQIFE